MWECRRVRCRVSRQQKFTQKLNAMFIKHRFPATGENSNIPIYRLQFNTRHFCFNNRIPANCSVSIFEEILGELMTI